MYDQNNTIVNGTNRRPISTNTTQATTGHSRRGKKPVNSESLKLALAAFAGAGVGGGAMWAGTHAAQGGVVVDPVADDNSTESAEAQLSIAQPSEASVTAADVDASAAQQAAQETRDKNVESETQKHPRHDHTPHPHQPEPDPEPVGPTPRPVSHTFEIGEVEEYTDSEGNTVRLAQGKMDGHEAIFHVDENNQVQAALVDLNDNGEFERNEVMDLRSENLVAVTHENPEVRVISVENDVDLDGQQVNIAHVAVGDDEALLVDANQNGEVDYLAHDDNHNGQVDDGEVHDISERHMPMPTVDDVESSGAELAQNDGLPDYSNDSDITMYEA